MDIGLFTQGIIIGLTLAVPVGPLSLLCIQRTLAGGRLCGIVAGLGVATADSCYAAISVLGLTFISAPIISHQAVFRLLAAIILILVGIRVAVTVPAKVSARHEQESCFTDYLSMLTLALANPLTLVFFIAILPGFGVIVQGTDLMSAAEFAGGLFTGSMAWWIFLCGSVGAVRSRISAENLRLINRGAGLLIVCFGAGLLVLALAASGTVLSP